ncbi:MAG: hypothetical protein U0354_17860 [Candidatus Sericytochromatia bacterium]
MKKSSLIKYLFPSFIIYFTACTMQSTQLTQVDKNTSNVFDLNLGPKGGGTIDPKVTSGQAIINFKEGDSILLFNINLKGSNNSFSTKDTKTNGNVITIIPSITPNSSPTPIPSPTASTKPNTISKISNKIYINERTYLLDIPQDKISNDKFTLNLSGLKKGSIVSVASEVFDTQNSSVGKESLQNKQVKEDVESFDLNVSVKIEINVSQKTEVNTSVNVNQSQVVSPVINITLPTQPTPSPTAISTPLPPPPPRLDCPDKICKRYL